jgi:hypothetical protein
MRKRKDRRGMSIPVGVKNMPDVDKLLDELMKEINSVPLWKRKWWRFQGIIQEAWFKIRMFFQRLFRGYSDNEWWNFKHEMSHWAIPRLKALRANHHGTPCTGYDDCTSNEEWNAILDQVIEAFQLVDDDEWSDANDTKIKTGLELFATYFTTMWD